ncbi:purine-binding chemotaxis protein CheW [bacterium]|nr:purine-binding chemotaxis protein CheW [bacterium]
MEHITNNNHSDSVTQLVVFSLHGQDYGVPIQFVREIIRHPEVTQLPNTPHFVRGVINLRGQIIPIISLYERFNFNEVDDSSKVVIVEYGGLIVGLEVNEVSQVHTLSADRISSAPSITSSLDSEFIAGVGKLGERLLIILNVERILSDEENEQLRKHAA